MKPTEQGGKVGKSKVGQSGLGIGDSDLAPSKKTPSSKLDAAGKEKRAALERGESMVKNPANPFNEKTKEGGFGKAPKNATAAQKRAAEAEIDQALDAVGGKKLVAAKDRLLKQSESTKAELDGALAAVDKTLGSKPYDGRKMAQINDTIGDGPKTIRAPLKGAARITEKAIAEEGGDLRKIKDVARATIAVDRVSDVGRTIEVLEGAAKKQGMTILAIKDRNNKPAVGGYRDVLIHMKHKDGTISEVQINTKQMITAKEGKGHKLYETIRNPSSTRSQKDRAERESEQLYSRAWQKSRAGVKLDAGDVG